MIVLLKLYVWILSQPSQSLFIGYCFSASLNALAPFNPIRFSVCTKTITRIIHPHSSLWFFSQTMQKKIIESCMNLQHLTQCFRTIVSNLVACFHFSSLNHLNSPFSAIFSQLSNLSCPEPTLLCLFSATQQQLLLRHQSGHYLWNVKIISSSYFTMLLSNSISGNSKVLCLFWVLHKVLLHLHHQSQYLWPTICHQMCIHKQTFCFQTL